MQLTKWSLHYSWSALSPCLIFQGMFVAIFGPTLPDLQHQVGVDTKRGALLFTFGGIGRILGSFVCIVLYGLLNSWLLFCIGILIMPIAAFALPHIHNYALMAFVFAFQGYAAGSLGAGEDLFFLRNYLAHPSKSPDVCV